MMNSSYQPEGPLNQIDKLMERCWGEDLMDRGDLDGLKQRLAKSNNLPEVSTAAVDALLDARVAVTDLMSIAITARMYQSVPRSEQIELWELTAYRCLRALQWAERMGIYRDLYERVRQKGIEPVLLHLQVLQSGMPMNDGEWQGIRDAIYSTYRDAMDDDRPKRFENWQYPAEEDDDDV